MAIKSVSISPEFLEGEDGSALTFEEADFVDGVWSRKVQAKSDSDGDSCDVIVVTDSKNDDGSDMTAKETIEIERTLIGSFSDFSKNPKVGVSYPLSYIVTGEKCSELLKRVPIGMISVEWVFDTYDGSDGIVSFSEWEGEFESEKKSSVSVDKEGTLTIRLMFNDIILDKLVIYFSDLSMSDLIEAISERGLVVDESNILSRAYICLNNYGVGYYWDDIPANSPTIDTGCYLIKSDITYEMLKELYDSDIKEFIKVAYGEIVKCKYTISQYTKKSKATINTYKREYWSEEEYENETSAFNSVINGFEKCEPVITNKINDINSNQYPSSGKYEIYQKAHLSQTSVYYGGHILYEVKCENILSEKLFRDTVFTRETVSGSSLGVSCEVTARYRVKYYDSINDDGKFKYKYIFKKYYPDDLNGEFLMDVESLYEDYIDVIGSGRIIKNIYMREGNEITSCYRKLVEITGGLKHVI